MLRFFLSDDGKIARVYTETRLYQQCYDLRVASFDRSKPDEASPIDDQLEWYRELTAAEFLAETRGKPIADKALELLAAERGVKCYVDREVKWWVCGLLLRLVVASDVCSQFHGHEPGSCYPPIEETDLPTILASEPGKRHREAIEEFILSLPVVEEEPKVEKTKPRVRCFRGRCRTDAWCIIDRGDVKIDETPKGWYWCDGWRAVTPNIVWNFNNEAEISVTECRREYPHPAFLAKLDELLRETGEYVEPQPERGDYVICFADCPEDDSTLFAVTREEAIAHATSVCPREDGAMVSLRPLGPAILTLRSVEKVTWEVEEVPNVPSN